MNKPLCGKCATEHWRFVACADAPTVNEREAANATKREATKVYPQWRKPDGRIAPTTASWSTQPFHTKGK
jgi:hypothetical protein